MGGKGSEEDELLRHANEAEPHQLLTSCTTEAFRDRSDIHLPRQTSSREFCLLNRERGGPPAGRVRLRSTQRGAREKSGRSVFYERARKRKGYRASRGKPKPDSSIEINRTGAGTSKGLSGRGGDMAPDTRSLLRNEPDGRHQKRSVARDGVTDTINFTMGEF